MFDLSENDKVDRRHNLNLATIKSGTFRQVETSTRQEPGDSPSGFVQRRTVETRETTVTKPWYAEDEGSFELFRSNATSLGNDYAVGATTTWNRKTYIDGVLTEEDSGSYDDDSFRVEIFY